MIFEYFPSLWTGWIALLAIVCPAVLVAILGVRALFGVKMSESAMNRWTAGTTITGLSALLVLMVVFIATGTRSADIELGNWISLPDVHFHFHIKFVFDWLSIPFSILTYMLCGLVSVFSSRYLHRDAGFSRFYVCYAFFTFGMVFSALAGTIEVLFVGWEMVGISSAMLVAFFHERPATVRNGQRIWSIYRLSDAAFLAAALYLHHLTGEGDLQALTGDGIWPHGVASVAHDQAVLVGVLLLIAAAGKSGLIPFSGWLPRAMEGPTPSSAIFYGALSVHLGAYLLLRVSPLLAVSQGLSVAIIILGLTTSMVAGLCARVQTDIKSALAFASLTQVGIIVAEVGAGFKWIALVHIIGHAFLRTFQLLRAPNLLHDYHTIENAIGGRPDHPDSLILRIIPVGIRNFLYRFALERGFLDGLIDRFVITPFLATFRFFNTLESRWLLLLGGNQKQKGNSDIKPLQKSSR